MSYVRAIGPEAAPPSREPPFVKASLLRRIRDVFSRVRDLLHSLASYFHSLKGAEDSPETRRIKKLRMLSDMNVRAYLQTLPPGMTFDYQYLSGMKNQIDPNANLIGIPLILKGTFRNHIVGIVINKENMTLEFYDSKGLTILDRKNDTLLHGSHTLSDFVSTLWQEGYTIVENTTKHQKDCHNCGVYVSHFFKQRAEGTRDVLTYAQANDTFRREMIRAINTPQG